MAAKRVLELRSWADADSYYITLSGHYKVLQSLLIPLPIKEKLDQARVSYMPKTCYDKQGSHIRFFANDYARVTHIMKRSASEEVTVVSREQVSDCLLEDDWSIIGFSVYAGVNPENMTVAEKWCKTCKLDED